VALASGLELASVRAALDANLRWVGREEGSGARRCLDRLLGRGRGRRRLKLSRHLACDHAGVVEAIRAGWAQAGVCVRYPAEEAGLAFLSVQLEDYDLCYPVEFEGDPRMAALIQAVRSVPYRRCVSELEGYDAQQSGEVRSIG
jgi:molybdate-binding protein